METSLQHTRDPGSEMMLRAVGVGPRTGQGRGHSPPPPQEPFFPQCGKIIARLIFDKSVCAC